VVIQGAVQSSYKVQMSTENVVGVHLPVFDVVNERTGPRMCLLVLRLSYVSSRYDWFGQRWSASQCLQRPLPQGVGVHCEACFIASMYPFLFHLNFLRLLS
jgi:hypothetical protein